MGDCQPVVQEAEREPGHRHQGEHEHAAGAQGRRPESAQGGESPSLNFPPNCSQNLIPIFLTGAVPATGHPKVGGGQPMETDSEQGTESAGLHQLHFLVKS